MDFQTELFPIMQNLESSSCSTSVVHCKLAPTHWTAAAAQHPKHWNTSLHNNYPIKRTMAIDPADLYLSFSISRVSRFYIKVFQYILWPTSLSLCNIYPIMDFHPRQFRDIDLLVFWVRSFLNFLSELQTENIPATHLCHIQNNEFTVFKKTHRLLK